MRLTAHLGGLESGNIEDRAVSGEECVELAAEVFLLVLLRQILDVKGRIRRDRLCRRHLGGYATRIGSGDARKEV